MRLRPDRHQIPLYRYQIPFSRYDITSVFNLHRVFKGLHDAGTA